MKKLFIALTLSASLLPGCGSDFTPVTPDSGRRAHTAVVINDKMYVFGGLGDGTFLNDLWEYDFTTFVWSQKNPAAPGPGARTYAAAVTDVSGNMYVLGGYDGTNRTAPVFYSDIWKYVPDATGTTDGIWEDVTPTNMPALSGHSAVINGADIYIFGGYDGKDYINTLWSCDLSTATGSCSIIAPGTGPTPTKRAYHSAVIASGTMYIFGGFGLNSSSTISNLDELWKYDIASNSWESIPLSPALPDGPIPSARSKHTAVLGIDGATPTLFVFGGIGSTSNKIWFYDIGANAWTESTDEFTTAPASRASHSAVVNGGNMYIYGGYISSGATVSLNDLWEFEPKPSPELDIWTPLTSPPRQ